MPWFIYSIAATTIFGILMALYKFPAAKSLNKTAAVFWSFVSSGVLAFIFFFNDLPTITMTTVLIAGFWGISFTFLSLLQMKALDYIETNTLYPITTTLSLSIAVLAAFIGFNESVSLLQGLGILLVVAIVYLFLSSSKSKKKRVGANMLLLFGTGIVFFSAFNKILQKIAVDSVNIYSYQIMQYVCGALFVSLLFLIRKTKPKDIMKSAPIGSTLGILGFLGGLAYLTALSLGPFSLVASVHSLYIFITAIVAVFLFQEKLTPKKIALVLVAIAALVLIRLG